MRSFLEQLGLALGLPGIFWSITSSTKFLARAHRLRLVQVHQPRGSLRGYRSRTSPPVGAVIVLLASVGFVIIPRTDPNLWNEHPADVTSLCGTMDAFERFVAFSNLRYPARLLFRLDARSCRVTKVFLHRSKRASNRYQRGGQ